MKKWMVYMLISSFTSGFVIAEEKAPWWELRVGDNDENKAEIQESEQSKSRRLTEDHKGKHRQRQSQMSEEQRAKIKANYQAIQKLAAKARNETDPVKKEELIQQLRVKLTKSAARRQAEFRRRLEMAEADVVKMKKRLAEQEKDQGKRVEKQLERLLSGEHPPKKKGEQHPGGAGPRPDVQ